MRCDLQRARDDVWGRDAERIDMLPDDGNVTPANVPANDANTANAPAEQANTPAEQANVPAGRKRTSKANTPVQ